MQMHLTQRGWPSAASLRHSVKLQCRHIISLNCSASQQPQVNAGVLVLDATNILSGAAAGRKRLTGVNAVSLRTCFEDWVIFLAAATAQPGKDPLVIAVFDNPGIKSRKRQGDGDYLRRRDRRHERPATSNHAAKLKPFIDYIERLQGVSIVAEGGYEADDCIGAICTLLHNKGITTDANSIIIASGDSDMQQYLAPNVSWLEILPLPTLAAPLGLALLTADEFLQARGYPASSYGDFLALTGKKEANVGGIGIGTSVSTKLLKQFGSIEAIACAAQQGKLKGWPPAVETSFSPGSKMMTQIQRNRDLLRAETDPDLVLSPGQQERIVQAAVRKTRTPSSAFQASKGSEATIENAPSNNNSTSNRNLSAIRPLIWKHPMNVGRWRYVDPLAQQLSTKLNDQGLGPCQVQATVAPYGLPVDLVVGGKAFMLCCAEDFGAQHAPNDADRENFSMANIESVLKSEESGILDPGKISGKLNRTMQHHIGLLKKAGMPPLLVPWWAM